jgi:hypothetical protein
MFVNVEYAESNSSYVLEMSQRSSIQESTKCSSDVEFLSPTLENVMVLDNEVGQESKTWEQEIGCMSHEQIVSLSAVTHEEAIGIITMEDVMEELLQVSIVVFAISYKFLVIKIR